MKISGIKRIEFKAQPADKTILCRRFRVDGSEADSITYTKNGIKPHRGSLTESDAADWDSAVEQVGWYHQQEDNE